MRVGPFSNDVVINYLNERFVPLYVVNEDYRDGKAGPEERKLLYSIWARAEEKRLPSGTVHVYLLTPDADVIDSMHVQYAMDTLTLLRFLREHSEHYGVEPGNTLVKPCPQSRPPKSREDQLVLHAQSDYTDLAGLPTESWIKLERDEWQEFIPDTEFAPLQEWTLSEQLTKKILVHLYPYAPDWDHSFEQFAKAELTAYVLERTSQGASVAIRGESVMSHNRQPGRDPQRVSVQIVGLIKTAPGKKPTIQLTTSRAFFADRPFAGLVEGH